MSISRLRLAQLTMSLGLFFAVSDLHAEPLAAGSTCTLSGKLALSPKPGAPAGASLAKDATVTIVEVAKGWVSVQSGEMLGQAKLRDLRRFCKNVVPLTHETGSVCRLAKPIRLSAKPDGKGKRVVAKVGVELTVVETTAKAYKVTLSDAAGYAPLGVLNKNCTWRDELGARTEPALATPAAAAEPADAPVVSNAATQPAAAAPLAPPPAAPRVVAKDDAPGKTKIAVMDLRHADNIGKDLVQSLGSLIPQVLDETGAFKAISAQDINQMLALEAMKDQTGCDSATCMAEIGGALGADYMVAGSIALVGETYVIQLQLMNITKARAEGRVSREYAGGPAGLFDEMRTATKLLVRDILTAQSGQLVLVVSEEGATVRIDGTIVGTSPLVPQPVPGGMHTVTVDKEGFVRFSKDVEIQAHQDTQARAQMRPSEDFLAQYRSHTGTVRALAWTSIATAVAGLGAGGLLYAMTGAKAKTAADQIRQYNESTAPTTADYNKVTQAKKNVATFDALTLTAGGIGVVAGVAGALLYTLGDDPHRYDGLGVSTVSGSEAKTTSSLSCWITPHSVGLAVGF